MNIMGMKYFNHNNNYYVDGHKRKDIMNEIWKYVKKYLTNKLRMYRWVKITERIYQNQLRLRRI